MMERCHPKRSGVAAGVLSLLLWLLVSSDHTDPAAQVAPGVRNQSFASHVRIAEVVGLEGEGGAEVERGAGPAGDRAPLDQPRPDPVSLPISAPEDSRRSPASHDAPLLPSSIAAPDVEVRVGEHGDFERVVFEWPESIEHAVVRYADEVVIAFARPGRIDLAKLKGFGRRLVEAWADGGDASRQVVLRVLPEVTIRSFSLESDRIVVIDLLGEPASRRAASPATETEPAASAGTRREGTARTGLSPSHGRIGIDHEHLQSNGQAAPNVDVRAGDHGDFERIVFEWPEGIAHNVAQRGEQVTVAFSRPGRIDLSGVRHRLNGRVLEVWADRDDATSQVTLRVSPDAEIRSFALKDDRVVVVDVFGRSPAQGPTRPGPDLAQDPVGELRRELEQRDAVIDGLQARVEQLERGAVLSGDGLDRIAAGRTPSLGGRSLPQPVAPSVAAAEPPPSGPASQQEAPTAGENQGEGTSAPAQPGQFEVVDEEIDRALERTLVQTGVLLLPVGQAEIEPTLSYTRREGSIPVLFTEDETTFIAEQNVRRNEFENAQILRVGMPFDSQFEIGAPYRYVDQSAVTEVGGRARQEVDGSGQGLGDISVGVAKTLLRENGNWWPDLVARIVWDTDSGQASDSDILLGGSFNELRGALNAVKRQDPLAFVAGLSYQTSFESDNVQPGDELGFSIGTVLAASPETSLRLALGQRFIDNAKVDGEGFDGTDRAVGTATFGASVVLGRGILLDVSADIGLTDDAPDYAARASLPIRFNLPVY